MRDLFKVFLVGIVFCFSSAVWAESYKVLILPDNIVTETVALDSYIYNAASEFFSDEVATILNNTDYIKAQPVSQTRDLLKKDPSAMIAAKNLTQRFRTSYNIDFVNLKKIADKTDSRYVLLITSYIDAENYILRRTPWDFLNVAGASVIDPAYKISTYAVLADTKNNTKLWSDTYYKTISVVENRIITRGSSPQTEQLAKIKDYSRYLCPQIAQNVQINVLPPEVFAKESSQVHYDIGNIDNVFTKKYRHLGKEYNKVYAQKKAEYELFKEDTKIKIEDKKQELKEASEARKIRNAEKKAQKEEAKLQSKLEVKATPVYTNTVEESSLNEITNKVKEKSTEIKDAVFRKPVQQPQQNVQPVNTLKTDTQIDNPYYNTDIINSFDLKRKKRNGLLENYDSDRPELRGYYN